MCSSCHNMKRLRGIILTASLVLGVFLVCKSKGSTTTKVSLLVDSGTNLAILCPVDGLQFGQWKKGGQIIASRTILSHQLHKKKNINANYEGLFYRLLLRNATEIDFDTYCCETIYKNLPREYCTSLKLHENGNQELLETNECWVTYSPFNDRIIVNNDGMQKASMPLYKNGSVNQGNFSCLERSLADEMYTWKINGITVYTMACFCSVMLVFGMSMLCLRNNNRDNSIE